MSRFGVDSAAFVCWKNSVEIVTWGSEDGVRLEMDKVMDHPTIRTDAEPDAKRIKANSKLNTRLYILTIGEATGILYLFRAKWGERKGNGLAAWDAL